MYPEFGRRTGTVYTSANETFTFSKYTDMSGLRSDRAVVTNVTTRSDTYLEGNWIWIAREHCMEEICGLHGLHGLHMGQSKHSQGGEQLADESFRIAESCIHM
jgi:hypothetical protein